MSVTGIGDTSGIGEAAGAAAQRKEGAGKSQSPEETFLAYVKKSPVERWIESWLKSHGLTKEEYDALPPERHDALAKEMAEDLKKAAQQKRV